jgi:hypothetical protein
MPYSSLSFKESEKLTSEFPLFSTDSFKRYGAIGDGNCMFHAFLFLVDEEYRSLTTIEDKQQYASKVRKAFAKKVKTLLQNPPKKPSDRVLKQKLEDFKGFFDETNTLESFTKKLAQPKEWCGEHVWNLLEMIHSTHIFLFLDDHTTNKTTVYCRGLDRSNVVYDKAVFILNINGEHYEPIASIEKGRLRSVFNITDPVSQKHLSVIDDLCKTTTTDTSPKKEDAEDAGNDLSKIGSKSPEAIPPPPYEDTDDVFAPSVHEHDQDHDYDEEILGNANVVFVQDENLSDIVFVRQKDINFVQYTKDQFTNTFHDLKVKADKKAVDTFYHLYKSSYDDHAQTHDVATSSSASMVYPVVHAALQHDEDDTKLTQYFSQRDLIQKQKDDYRIRQQKLYELQVPFVNDRSEGVSMAAMEDQDVIISSDIQPLSFLRVMGKIPIYLPKDIDYIYKGDQITVHGYATKTSHRDMYKRGRFSKFNIQHYHSNVATLKINDVVDIYFNDFFYDGNDDATPLTYTSGTIYERDEKFIKIKLASSIRQGHEATLKNIIYYQVDKYNPFYIYAAGTSTDSVFYKPLLVAADSEWMFTPLLDTSVEKTLAFILPTLSELVFMFREDTRDGFYQNLRDIVSLLKKHGYSFERVLPSEFQKIKHVIEYNTSKQVEAHKQAHKATPVTTRPPSHDTQFSKQSSFKTRKMAETVYPELRLSSDKSHQDYIFQLFKQKDRGYLFILKLYQQLLETHLQNYSESDLTNRLKAAETLIASLRKDVATLKNPFLVKSTNLDIAVFYDDVQKLELDQHKVRGEWYNRYAILDYKNTISLYKRLDHQWVRLCEMNERQEFDLLPLFSVHLSLLFDELTPEKLGDGLPLLQSVAQLANTEHVKKSLEDIIASLPVANVHAHIGYVQALVESVYVQDYVPPEKEYKLRTDVGQGELDEDLEDIMGHLDMNEAAAYSELRPDQQQQQEVKAAMDDTNGKPNEEKQLLITTIAARMGLTLTTTEIALIYNSLPLFEKLVLEEKLVALKTKEGAKLKGLSQIELMKKLFKSPAEKKQFFHTYSIYVISAFLAIYLQMKPYHTIQSHVNQCALTTLEEDDVMQYVSCCLSELYTKEFADTAKTLAKMKQTYKKVLGERPVFTSLLKARHFQRDQEAKSVPASSWDTFRPPKKITTNSVPVAAYFKRLFERAAEEKPLKVSVSKVPYFRNACCITSLTNDYRYEKNFRDASQAPTLLMSLPTSVVIPSKEQEQRQHLFTGKQVTVPSEVVHKLAHTDVDLTDIVWQLNKFMEKNPLFKKDKVLTHLFENIAKEQAWFKFAGTTETLFDFVQEYLRTSSRNNLEFMTSLKATTVSLEVSNEEMPAVCNAMLAFVKNDMKRIVATAMNDYDVVTRLGRTTNKYLRKNPSEVAIIESAVKSRDTFSNMRFGIRQNETFQSSGVKEVIYKLIQQAAQVSSIYGIESSNHLSKTIKLLSIVNYIHLKFVLLLIWAITLESPADFDSRHEEYEEGDVARYIQDIKFVQSTGDKESLVAVTQSLAYAIEISLHQKVESFKNVATSLKTGIEVMREAKKMKKIEINEMLDEENRGIIKQLEKLGLITLQQTLRGTTTEDDGGGDGLNTEPFPEMTNLRDEEPVRQDISESHNRSEEEENYIIPQHIGENEDELNEDDYHEY